MKNLFLSVTALAIVAFTGISCSSDDNNSSDNNSQGTVIQVSELATEGKTFLDTHFVNIEIIRVEKDIRSIDEYYEVYLATGTEIDFDQAGNWTGIDGNYKAIPTGFINPNIVAYVTTNYPITAIEGIDKEVYGYEVDLLNNIELRFDLEGNFLGLGH